MSPDQAEWQPQPGGNASSPLILQDFVPSRFKKSKAWKVAFGIPFNVTSPYVEENSVCGMPLSSKTSLATHQQSVSHASSSVRQALQTSAAPLIESTHVFLVQVTAAVEDVEREFHSVQWISRSGREDWATMF